MSNFVIVMQPEKRGRFDHYENHPRLHSFSTESEVIKFVGNNKSDMARMLIFNLDNKLLPTNFLQSFEDRKRMALSKLTDEDRVILGVR